jgi:hypothetical protein
MHVTYTVQADREPKFLKNFADVEVEPHVSRGRRPSDMPVVITWENPIQALKVSL